MKQAFFIISIAFFLASCADFKSISLKEGFDVDKKGITGKMEFEEKF